MSYMYLLFSGNETATCSPVKRRTGVQFIIGILYDVHVNARLKISEKYAY